MGFIPGTQNWFNIQNSITAIHDIKKNHMTTSIDARKVFDNIHHSKMKHIELRYHFIKDHILKGNIELIFFPSHEEIADVLQRLFMLQSSIVFYKC